MSALRTRRPTGAVAYPVLLVEGPEKSGKTYTALSLAASERVGRTFVFELGERAADEYAPLGDYEIVDHNGTYTDLLDQVRAATREPQEDDRPNVVVLDSASMLWSMLKDQASAAARRSKRGRQILADDPDADIEVTMTYWTAAKDKWWAVINALRSWPGITILTARAGEVTKVHGGQPVAGQTEWSRDVEKGTPFAVTGIVRCQHPKPPVLSTVQSLSLSIPPKGLELPLDASLESLIFDTLGAGGFEQVPVTNPSEGRPAADAKAMLWADACEWWERETAREMAAKAWAEADLTDRAQVTDAELARAKSLLEAAAEGVDKFADLPHATPDKDATQQGAGVDGPASGGDAAMSGDGAGSHDVGRTEPEPAPDLGDDSQ